jgi:hypothetical protein
MSHKSLKTKVSTDSGNLDHLYSCNAMFPVKNGKSIAVLWLSNSKCFHITEHSKIKIRRLLF